MAGGGGGSSGGAPKYQGEEWGGAVQGMFDPIGIIPLESITGQSYGQAEAPRATPRPGQGIVTTGAQPTSLQSLLAQMQARNQRYS